MYYSCSIFWSSYLFRSFNNNRYIINNIDNLSVTKTTIDDIHDWGVKKINN